MYQVVEKDNLLQVGMWLELPSLEVEELVISMEDSQVYG